MNSLIDNIIANVVLSSKPCSKFLESDGISSRIFLLRGFDNKKIINFKDVKTLRNKIPSSGLAITIVKNFDEYQYIICGYIPKLNDNNFFKIKFQKIRILVFLFFYRLSQILVEMRGPDALDEWIRESNALLIETSQIILDYRELIKKNGDTNSLNSNQQIINRNDKLNKDYFDYFETSEDKIDKLLYSIYGINV